MQGVSAETCGTKLDAAPGQCRTGVAVHISGRTHARTWAGGPGPHSGRIGRVAAVKLLPLPPKGRTPVRALTIAGTDSGGGAGIQADSRTMAMCGVHACVAVAAVTVQNSVGVSGFHEIPPETVAAQVRCVVEDIGVSGAKTGMLASTGIIEAVAAVCAEVGIGRDRPVPLVVDPVCASMHGDPLLHAEALDAVRHTLIPQATVVTPNLDEVRLITGIEVVEDRKSVV